MTTLVVDPLAIAALVSFCILLAICIGIIVWIWLKAMTAPDPEPIHDVPDDTAT